MTRGNAKQHFRRPPCPDDLLAEPRQMPFPAIANPLPHRT
jgi:hypothetical protein